MAVNPNDAAYKAEVVPESIKRLGIRLRAAYGVGPDNFGERGNLAHTSGYHRSRRYNRVHVPGNYSIVLAADKQGDENWICAFDITPGVWGSPDNRQRMIAMTKRMRAAARAHDPRISALREFAGTEDGKRVVTIDMQTGADREPFDDTHRDHGHGSLFRGRAAEDHTGIFEVITGGDMPLVPADVDLIWNAPVDQGPVNGWDAPPQGFLAPPASGAVPAWMRLADASRRAYLAYAGTVAIYNLTKAIAEKIDIDPAELAAIEAAANTGTAAAMAAAADVWVARILAGVQAGGAFTPEQEAQIERNVRDAFAGGLAPAPSE